MARWKACIRLPIRHNWTFFASSYRWGATRQNVSSLVAIRRGRSVWAKISGGRGRPCGIFFGLYKTIHILLSDSANCTVLCVVVLTQYWRVTDGRTDRRTEFAVASTALSMWALGRAVKLTRHWNMMFYHGIVVIYYSMLLYAAYCYRPSSVVCLSVCLSH